MKYIFIKGEEIIRLWNLANEMTKNIPNYESYAQKYIDRTGMFKATNSMFCNTYFKPSDLELSFRMNKFHGSWKLNEYVGLYGKATEIRYIKPQIDYIINVVNDVE